MMRRVPMKPSTARMKLNAFARCKRIEAREVTKFPARYRKSINVPPRDLARYHWNTNLRRNVDERLLASGEATLAAGTPILQ